MFRVKADVAGGPSKVLDGPSDVAGGSSKVSRARTADVHGAVLPPVHVVPVPGR